MDLYLIHLQRLVSLTFGAGAVLAGSIGVPGSPGSIEVRTDGRLLASGGTFQELLVDASRRAADDRC